MARKTDETWAKLQGARILLKNALRAYEEARAAEIAAYEAHCAAVEAENAEAKRSARGPRGRLG